jgi:hypothetical protein
MLALTTLFSSESTISQHKAESALPQAGKPSWTKRLLLDYDFAPKSGIGFISTDIVIVPV